MRLQLILLVLARVAAADPDVTAAARTSVYADSDHTNVVTSAVGASGNVASDVRIDAQYLVDAVSAASVDVITAATGRIHDVRNELTTGVTVGPVHAAYIYSDEHDWTSHTGALGVTHDLADHQLTLGATATLGINHVTKMGDMDFSRKLGTGGLEVYAAYTATPRDVILVGVGGSYLSGYQASPYRFVVYGDLRAVFERVPATRPRETVTLRWNHHLFRDSALRTQVRGYRDDWGIWALTASAEYIVGVGPVDLGAHVRGYTQSEASFYLPYYPTERKYMTHDRELTRFRDGFAGITAVYLDELFGQDVRIELDVDAFAFRFDEFASLRSRTGIVAGLGVGLAL